jgi:hypothetical protein
MRPEPALSGAEWGHRKLCHLTMDRQVAFSLRRGGLRCAPTLGGHTRIEHAASGRRKPIFLTISGQRQILIGSDFA